MKQFIQSLTTGQSVTVRVAVAIVRALDDVELRQKARDYNVKLVVERAEYGKVMARAERFYQQVIESARMEQRVS